MARSQRVTQARRAAEAAQRRDEAARRKRNRSLLTGGVIGLVVIGGLFAYAQLYNRGFAPPEGVKTYAGLEQNHVDGDVEYPQDPPVGGNHAGVWQNCGFYDQPIRKENGVHSLEHGAVWITYQEDLSADQVAVIKNLVNSDTFLLASPYPGLDSAVVATQWGVQLRLASANDPGLAQFVKVYKQGPQTPEPGAACAGGVGEPLE